MSWRMTTGGTACRHTMAAGQQPAHWLKHCTRSTMGCTASSRCCRLSWRRSLRPSVKVRGRPFMQCAACYTPPLPYLCLVARTYLWTEHTITILSTWQQQQCQDHQIEVHDFALHGRCMQRPAQVAVCREGPEHSCLLTGVARHLAAVERAVQGVESEVETVEGYVNSITDSIRDSLQTEEAVSGKKLPLHT